MPFQPGIPKQAGPMKHVVEQVRLSPRNENLTWHCFAVGRQVCWGLVAQHWARALHEGGEVMVGPF